MDPKKIALIGATGFVGQAVLDELLSRGHQVTALARHPEKLAARPGLRVIKGDAQVIHDVRQAVEGTDMVVSAYNPGHALPDIQAQFILGSRAIVAGVKAAGVPRLLVVGGAGSLFVAPDVQLVDTPEFPAEWKEGALGARQALRDLQAETALDWTFVSPAMMLEPGERTGRYRLGQDAPLTTGDGPGRISTADLAVAIVDEVEQHRHPRQRFTLAY